MFRRRLHMEIPLWYYFPYIMILPATVLAILPLPKNSLDWCAAENSSVILPPAPPEPTFHNLARFPDFDCKPLTKEECDAMAALYIPKCVGSTFVDLDLDRPESKAYGTMFGMKFRNVSLGIQFVPPNRPVILGVWDIPLTIPAVTTSVDLQTLQEDIFINQALNPIRHNIIDFRLYNCGRRCTGKLPALNFTSLLSFTITCDPSYRAPGVTFRRGDFAENLRLRSLSVGKCPKLEIEPHTFTNLADLRILALEKDYFGSWMDKAKAWPFLRVVHCDCEYAWLRDLFRVNSGLITPKAKGAIYQVCQIDSREFTKEDIFVPVNCSKSDLQEINWKQGSYSAKGAYGTAVRYAAGVRSGFLLMLVALVQMVLCL